MELYQSVFLLFFTAIAVGSGLHFYYKNRKLQHAHLRLVNGLENAISLNRNQLRHREKNLGKYDFEKYNFSEALVPQQEIDIKNL